MSFPPDAPRLFATRARTLRRDDGRVLASAPVVLFHPLRVVRLGTALAKLSFGPAAALRLPAGVMAQCEDHDAFDEALALWFTAPDALPGTARRELLPSRIAITLEDFGGLLRVWHGAREGEAVQAPLRWLRRDHAARQHARNGNRYALEAWKKWSALAVDVEVALFEAAATGALTDPLPADATHQERRAVARLLGLSVQGGLAEFRRRRLLAVAAARGALDDATMRAAGFKSRRWCEREFDMVCGEGPEHWLQRHGLVAPPPASAAGGG